jgi:hypothetical protein
MCSTSGLWGNWSLILVGLGWIPSFQENKKKRFSRFNYKSNGRIQVLKLPTKKQNLNLAEHEYL